MSSDGNNNNSSFTYEHDAWRIKKLFVHGHVILWLFSNLGLADSPSMYLLDNWVRDRDGVYHSCIITYFDSWRSLHTKKEEELETMISLCPTLRVTFSLSFFEENLNLFPPGNPTLLYLFISQKTGINGHHHQVPWFRIPLRPVLGGLEWRPRQENRTSRRDAGVHMSENLHYFLFLSFLYHPINTNPAGENVDFTSS